jgi:hypothetical protein
MRCIAGLLAAILCCPMVSVAEESVGLAQTLKARDAACSGVFCITGFYKHRYRTLTDFDLEASHAADPADSHGVLGQGRQQLRIRARINPFENFSIIAEADLLSGRLYGDMSTSGSDFLMDPDEALDFGDPRDLVQLRQAYLHWMTPAGLLRVGQQTSHFGLGILANGGNDEAHDVFDDPRLGDVVERAVFITKPLKPFVDGAFGDNLLLIGGFDVVYRDDNANLLDGDLGMQGVVSLVYKTEPFTAGVYMAIRDQEDEDGDTLSAQAYDLFLRWQHDFDDINARLVLSAEAVMVRGESTRALYEQAPDGVDIQGVGAVFQGSFELRDWGLESRLEVGFASGDNNRNDDLVRSFSFDPDYHVGMILFQEVMGRITTNTVSTLSDPSRMGQPPKGVEMVATDGAITNAIYVNPVLRWKSNFGLGIDAGMLWAQSVADVIDPWASAQFGGYNANHLGSTSGSHDLGIEVNAGLHYTHSVQDAVAFTAGVQYGMFLPGKAFEGPSGQKSLGTVSKLRATFDIAW